MVNIPIPKTYINYIDILFIESIKANIYIFIIGGLFKTKKNAKLAAFDFQS
jgi:hypothetical protein